VVLGPPKAWESVSLRELWRYRELLVFFIWRDLKVRYQQTILGASWAILQPLGTMLAFSIFFGKLAGLENRLSGDVPYSLFCLAGLTVFTIFSAGLARSTESVLANSAVVKKVYFPRLFLPLGAIGPVLVDFGFGCLALAGFCLYHGFVPGWSLLAAPVVVALAVAVTLGVGIWFSALCVQFRDVRHVVPFLSQIAMFATPIAYPIAIVPEQWQWLYSLNPMVGVVEGFRWSLFGGAFPDAVMIVSTVAISSVLLVSGVYFFQKQEQAFSDLV
jgi:lipopolysaccharide transport system permease protein